MFDIIDCDWRRKSALGSPGPLTRQRGPEERACMTPGGTQRPVNNSGTQSRWLCRLLTALDLKKEQQIVTISHITHNGFESKNTNKIEAD